MLTNYIMRHLQAGFYSLGKLTSTPITNFMTCLIIGIALALPAALFVALKNAEIISGSFQQTMQLTVFLKPSISATDAESLAHSLRSDEAIQTTKTISPADGLKELQQQAGLQDSLNNLQENPLPWVIVVSPKESARTPEALEQLQQRLQLLTDVDNVQLDMLWVKRLAMLIATAHRIAYALAAFLGIAVLLIVNNTIRSATQQHKPEIEVIKLIGGTNAFIRRPFLYAGMLYGLVGGVLALILVTLLVHFLKAPVNQLAGLYNSQFTLANIGIINTLFLLVFGVALGLLGSWVAVTRYLHDPT